MSNNSVSVSATFLLAICGSLLMPSASFGQHTYYISSSSGSDSNTAALAQSKSTPWKHLPGMWGCGSGCSNHLPANGYTPVAGDRFILKGGDTWGASELGMVWVWSGTSAASMYIGVDTSWFVGGSWTRPVFNGGGATISGTNNYSTYMFIAASYVTIDNIEFTGLYTNGTTSGYIATQLDHDIVQNSYFHGWFLAGGSTSDQTILVGFYKNNFSPYTSLGSGLFYSIIDGSDTAQNSMHAIGGEPTYIVGNIIQYVANAADNISTSVVHDNYWGPVVTSFQANAHQNALSIGGPDNSKTTQFIYNNIITGSTCSVCSGVVKIWLDQFAGSDVTGYAFNNVIYNNAPGNMIDQGHGNASTSYSTWYWFNNTVECGTDSNTSACVDASSAASTSIAVFKSQNNHWISSTAPILCAGGYSCPSTSDVTQTSAQAAAQGYNGATGFVFSPTAASNSTVGKGTNLESLCSTIGSINSDGAAAGQACQSDTGYSCVYSTSNHTVTCPKRPPLARPAAGAWDVGAYQYQAGQIVSGINPPPSLTATAF